MKLKNLLNENQDFFDFFDDVYTKEYGDDYESEEIPGGFQITITDGNVDDIIDDLNSIPDFVNNFSAEKIKNDTFNVVEI